MLVITSGSSRGGPYPKTTPRPPTDMPLALPGRPGWTIPALILLPAMLHAQSVPSCPNGLADDKSIRVDATVPFPLATVYQLGDSVLRAHGYTWTAASPVSERVTAPRYTWPPGSESEPWHGAESPGLV